MVLISFVDLVLYLCISVQQERGRAKYKSDDRMIHTFRTWRCEKRTVHERQAPWRCVRVPTTSSLFLARPSLSGLKLAIQGAQVRAPELSQAKVGMVAGGPCVRMFTTAAGFHAKDMAHAESREYGLYAVDCFILKSMAVGARATILRRPLVSFPRRSREAIVATRLVCNRIISNDVIVCVAQA